MNGIPGWRRGFVGGRGQTFFAVVVVAAMAVVFFTVYPASFRSFALYKVDILARGAGFDRVMPPDSRDGVALVRAAGLKRFWMGPGLAKRTMQMQRVGEGAFPARPDPTAPDIIEYRDAVESAACRVIAVRGKMAHVRCRR